MHSFLGTLTRDYRGKNVLVVYHSVVVLIFRRLLERWGEQQYLDVDRENDVRNCGITAYRFDIGGTKAGPGLLQRNALLIIDFRRIQILDESFGASNGRIIQFGLKLYF